MLMFAPFGTTTCSPTVIGAYREARNVLPILFLSESIASMVMTRMSVPAGTVTFLGCGGGSGAFAAAGGRLFTGAVAGAGAVAAGARPAAGAEAGEAGAGTAGGEARPAAGAAGASGEAGTVSAKPA